MPASFTDRHGQEWSISYTFGLIDRVKRETGIDVAKVMEDNNALARLLFMDMGRKLAEVLYATCEEQIAERGIEPEQWPDLFDGPTIERATTGFLEGISDFFPRSRVGKSIRENLPKMLAAMDKQLIGDLTKRLSRVGSGGSGGNLRDKPASPSTGSASGISG